MKGVRAWGQELSYTVEVPCGLVRMAEGLGLTMNKQLVRTALLQYMRHIEKTREYKRGLRADPTKYAELKRKRKDYYYRKEKKDGGATQEVGPED